MRRLLAVGAGAALCLGVLCAPLAARAMMIRPPAGPVKLVQADAVVVGKVMGLEDQDVAVAPAPGALNKVNYRIAVVKVTEHIKGAKGKNTIRVGFFAPAPVVPPGGGVRPFIRRRPGVSLTAGQEGILYLSKHPTASFYTIAYFGFTSSQAPNYAAELKTARKVVQMLANPVAALKGPSAKDRLLAAELLIHQYRTRRAGPAKIEPAGAEESKLILSALLDADWTARPIRFGETTPQMLFYQLGLTPKDGWTPPRQIRNAQDLTNAMRDWLRGHRDTYRIQRFVSAPASASR